MMTRTIKTNRYMCATIENGEVKYLPEVITTGERNDKQAVKAGKKLHGDDTIVKYQDSKTTLYGMTVENFIMNAEVIPAK